jgi:hypothetical protein
MPAANKRERKEPQTSLKDSLTERAELLQKDYFLYYPRHQ